MEILSEKRIKEDILPYLYFGKEGVKRDESEYIKIIKGILYRLKTGCQWRMLPLNEFGLKNKITWQGVYYYFSKWTVKKCWETIWKNILIKYRKYLDLSCVQLDGSQTISRGGGESVGYQGRKSKKTTNSLYLADNKGNMLAFSTPKAGNHNDLHEIEKAIKTIERKLLVANISLKGVFLNADAGFDSKKFRAICETMEINANIPKNKRNASVESDNYVYFDALLYNKRVIIEQANSWIDGFKALLICFEKKISTWSAFLFLGLLTLFFKRNKL